MSSNCRENTSADWSFSNRTRIFVVDCNVRTCCHNDGATLMHSQMVERFLANLAMIDQEPRAILCVPSCIHPKQSVYIFVKLSPYLMLSKYFKWESRWFVCLMATSDPNEQSFHLVITSQLFQTKRELCHFLIEP
jgi:hypothetical protein